MGFIFPTTYDQSLGLKELIKRAVGPNNLENINSNITQERFPLQGTDVRRVNLRVEPYKDGETRKEAAKRLTAAGHVLGNTGDLAGFLHDHPKEMEKWNWVLAISEDSSSAHPGGYVYAPYALVLGAFRVFGLPDGRYRLNSADGILVLCE